MLDCDMTDDLHYFSTSFLYTLPFIVQCCIVVLREGYWHGHLSCSVESTQYSLTNNHHNTSYTTLETAMLSAVRTDATFTKQS